MKKTTIVLVLVIQFALLLIFHNIYALFKSFEEVDLNRINDPMQLMENMKKMKSVFFILFIITGLFFLGTVVYLGIQLKLSKQKPEDRGIPPLHDYLLELKGSETELKSLVEKQQAHVIEKEELSKSIINNINAAVIFINRKERIDIFNAEAQQMFSQSYVHAKNNLVGNVLAKFPGMIEFIKNHENQKLSQEVTCGERVFLVDSNPIENIGQLFIIKDITEEKKQEEIDRRNSNFIMLGEMTAFLAHEVRNSLGVIYGYAKTIDTNKDKIDKVNKEIHFLSTMMESFLNFSRPVEVDKKQEIDLAELLKKISREHSLILELNSRDMVLTSDPTLLRSVFSNLCLNAREAGADRMEIGFKEKKNNEVEILLKDNGSGIKAETREKIWLPFFTTKDKGTGMGLAIIRKIINTLNGEIDLVDTGPQGTTFKITFYNS